MIYMTLCHTPSLSHILRHLTQLKCGTTLAISYMQFSDHFYDFSLPKLCNEHLVGFGMQRPFTTQQWSGHVYQERSILCSQKYWRELNLAVKPNIAIATVLADFNLAVRYGITIRIYASMKYWWIFIW